MFSKHCDTVRTFLRLGTLWDWAGGMWWPLLWKHTFGCATAEAGSDQIRLRAWFGVNTPYTALGC